MLKLEQNTKHKVIPNIPLSWFVRLLLSRQPGLQTNIDEDLHKSAPISSDVAMILATVDPNEEEIKIIAPFTEFNSTDRYRLFKKSDYLKSIDHWNDIKRRNKERRDMSFKRDELLEQVKTALQNYNQAAFGDDERAYSMAKEIIMNKNQAFLDALNIDVDITTLSDDVTKNCTIVDREFYVEEIKRQRNENELF